VGKKKVEASAVVAKREAQDFMARFKGVPGHKIARAMTSLSTGINWGGCPKGWMARRWANPNDTSTDKELRILTLDDIAGEITRIYG
jgi:hypothetical protein